MRTHQRCKKPGCPVASKFSGETVEERRKRKNRNQRKWRRNVKANNKEQYEQQLSKVRENNQKKREKERKRARVDPVYQEALRKRERDKKMGIPCEKEIEFHKRSE